MKNKLELLNKIIKDGFIEETVRIQIYPMYSYSADKEKEICDKYNITKEEFSEMLSIPPHHVSDDQVITHKQHFGFYNFKKTYDKLCFTFKENKIYEMNNH